MNNKLEESVYDYINVEGEGGFDGFGSDYYDEENKYYNDETYSYGDVVGDTEESIIETIDNPVFDSSKIDSKIQELKLSDGIFDFMGYQDWLEKFPVDLRKEIDEYVHREYSDLFRNDEDETEDETVKPTHSGFENYFDQDEQTFSSHDTRKRNRKSHKGKRNTDLYSPLEGLAA